MVTFRKYVNQFWIGEIVNFKIYDCRLWTAPLELNVQLLRRNAASFLTTRTIPVTSARTLVPDQGAGVRGTHVPVGNPLTKCTENKQGSNTIYKTLNSKTDTRNNHRVW